MEHLENLYEMKRELMDKFNNYLLMSTHSSLTMRNMPHQLQIIREEIEHINQRIEHEKSVSLSDAFISRKLHDVVNKTPEEYLDMMDIVDVEKYLRKKKLENINKKTT